MPSQFTIRVHNVPPGLYRLSIWAENVSAERLAALTRTIDIAPNTTHLAPIQLEATGDLTTHHESKFGEPYKPLPKDIY